MSNNSEAHIAFTLRSFSLFSFIYMHFKRWMLISNTDTVSNEEMGEHASNPCEPKAHASVCPKDSDCELRNPTTVNHTKLL